MTILSRAAIFFFLFVLAGTIGAVEKIDINTASEQELQAITGIGPALAQKVMDARPFFSVNDLIKVSGIGETTLQKITDQGLAWVDAQMEEPELEAEPKSKPPEPKITLSFPESNPANKEIEVIFSAVNLKNSAYDLKISIEKDSVLSDIYNKNKGAWQSSHYYINDLFSGSSFEETFKLKIREEYFNFRGEADILARVRESGQSAYLEHKEKINLSEPELRTENESLAAISQQVPETPVSFRILLIALTLAIFSGATVLALKTNFKK